MFPRSVKTKNFFAYEHTCHNYNNNNVHVKRPIMQAVGIGNAEKKDYTIYTGAYELVVGN